MFFFTRARVQIGPPASPRFDIHIMNADGSDVRRVAESPSSDSLPTFSRDGLKIAFVSRDLASEANYPRVFIMSVDGTNRQVVSPLGLRAMTAAEDPLYTMTAAGVDFRRVTPPKPEGTSIGDFGGMWSEDGGYVLVARSEVGTVIPLYKAHARTGAATRIAEMSSPTFYLADWWSPFGPD